MDRLHFDGEDSCQGNRRRHGFGERRCRQIGLLVVHGDGVAHRYSCHHLRSETELAYVHYPGSEAQHDSMG